MLLHQDPPEDLDIREPVYVTLAEHTEAMSFSKRTISDIDKSMLNMLSTIPDVEVREHLLQEYKTTVMRSKKDKHIAFFHKVHDALNSCCAFMEESTETYSGDTVS